MLCRSILKDGLRLSLHVLTRNLIMILCLHIRALASILAEHFRCKSLDKISIV